MEETDASSGRLFGRMALGEGEHLTKRFGGIVTVDDVAFAVNQSEAVKTSWCVSGACMGLS